MIVCSLAIYIHDGGQGHLPIGSWLKDMKFDCDFSWLIAAYAPCDVSAVQAGGYTWPSSSGYQYTLDNDLLTNAQRQSYEENGFLLIKGLVDKDDLENYRWVPAGSGPWIL